VVAPPPLPPPTFLSPANPYHSLFYCGDTCQTIARGIGFRFADIRTLIYEEAQQQKELEKDSNSQWGRVGMPSIEHLKVRSAASQLQLTSPFLASSTTLQALSCVAPSSISASYCI
jgi:hypothetical protein